MVTWGVADCSEVRDQLHGVREISGTYSAFAAILDGGTVVTWGDARCGGDSSGVQDQLRGVRLVQASLGAFAALLEDGSVVTWGDSEHGADSSQVQHQLKLGGVSEFHFIFPATLAMNP